MPPAPSALGVPTPRRAEGPSPCPSCGAPLRSFNYRCRRCGTVVDLAVARRLLRIRNALLLGLIGALLLEATFYGLRDGDLVWTLGLTGGLLALLGASTALRRPRGHARWGTLPP